jgi:hypothetical protein
MFGLTSPPGTLMHDKFENLPFKASGMFCTVFLEQGLAHSRLPIIFVEYIVELVTS